MRSIVAVLVGALALLAAAADAQPRSGASPAAPLAVPYLSQGELLCGGAAAAMLLRYWGARGVYADDFSALVDRGKGGITTAALETAVREKGWRTTAFTGSAERIRTALQRSQPVIALIEDRPGRYHYVVIVAWDDRSVVYHDPARGPLQVRDIQKFDRAWASAGRWALLVLPPPASQLPAVSMTSAGPHSETPSPLDAAMTAFEQRRYAESARLAQERLRENPDDAEAWRVLGASRYLRRDQEAALQAWNHAGEPRVDLVTVEGLEDTPHRIAERLIGVAPRSVLTPEGLRHADRRLALLPSAESTRVSYTALPGGLAEVTAAVVEDSHAPRLTDWLVQGVKLLFTRGLSVSFANVAELGERWTAMWRFHEGRPAVHVGIDLPAASLPGIWSVDAGWQKETFQVGGLTTASTRRDGRIGWTDWVAADTRVTLGAGAARWNGRGTRPIVDAAVQQRAVSDHLAFGVAVSGSPGSARFSTSVAHLAWRAGSPALRVSGSVVLSRANAHAPIDLWPYAGAGSGHELLLRAHDLREHGTLVNDVYGRRIDQGTIEVQHDVYSRGPATVAIAGFTDMGRISRRADGSASPFEMDVGVGFRIRTGTPDRVIRVDLARALRDDGMVFSVGWQVTWFERKAR